MSIREKKQWLILLFIICVAVFVGGIGFLVSDIRIQVRDAKKFCESLRPILEAERAQNGHYPERLNPDWWKSRKMPKLLHGKKFYWTLKDGECYVFGIDESDSFWSSRLGYNSQVGHWFEYDD